MKKPLLLSWSSGKDSAWTLYQLQNNPDYELKGLVTTVNATHQRVAMHAVRQQLLQMQAEAAGLPLHMIDIPYPCSNEQYQSIMGSFIEQVQQQGIEAFAFGDLFLEDIRAYRVKQLEGTGIEPVFPLWLKDTRELAQEMIAGGLRARITCVNPKRLDGSFAGRDFDEQFLRDLPDDVDPCGENGEFHSFVYAGPMLQHALPIETGEVVERDGFVFCDILRHEN